MSLMLVFWLLCLCSQGLKPTVGAGGVGGVNERMEASGGCGYGGEMVVGIMVASHCRVVVGLSVHSFGIENRPSCAQC